MIENNAQYRLEARSAFDKARQQAQIDQLTARLTGRDNRLLPFEAIRSELRTQNARYQGIQEIPVTQIVGSVGRYKDMTRTFLPLSDSMRERWVNITSLAMTEGWLPIELYKVGDVYFVKDGNHRVSAAQQLNMPTIEAHVWEYSDDISIRPEGNLDELLIRLGENNFMERTGLAERHPDHQIQFTTPGRYSELLAQIASLRDTLASIDGEILPYPEAVDAWYEMVYLPTVQIIHDSTLLEDFPGRTEADLFAWMSLMQRPLQEHYGESDNLEDLASLLAAEYKEGRVQKVARQMRSLLGSDKLPPLEGLDSTTPL